MKKKTALVLTLAMVFSLAPLSAYADTITTVGGTASHDVKATYRADSSGGAGGTVYSVDITWGDMRLPIRRKPVFGTLPPTKPPAPKAVSGR